LLECGEEITTGNTKKWAGKEVPKKVSGEIKRRMEKTGVTKLFNIKKKEEETEIGVTI
jgi:hypothetical protein